MAGKTKIIRTLTCFTATASLVLATVPAYGAEVPSPAAPQSPTSTESASTDGVNTPDPAQDANDVADSNGNDGLEIQNSGPETSTDQAEENSIQILYTGSTVAPGSLPLSNGAPLTKASYSGFSLAYSKKIGHGWCSDGVLMLNKYLGSKYPDLLFFDKRGDNVFIRLYRGAPGGKVYTVGDIGHAWNDFDLVMAGDINQDGKTDLLGRKTNGDLFYYEARKGSYYFKPGVKVGHGWTGMRTLTFMPHTIGNKPGVLAVDSDGRMHIYPFVNRGGNFASSVKLGYGWSRFTRVMRYGDADGNGKSDFLATDSSGYLYLYRANSAGNAFSPAQVGHAWNGMSQILPIDMSLGGGIMAVDSKGILHYYMAYRHGSSSRPGWRPPARYLQPVSKVRAPGTTVVPRRGWNGTKVREVRARMGVGVPLNAGMTFDQRTENAVKRFQRRIRVGANGVVDYRTWVKMTSRSWTMDNFQMRPVPLSANRSQRVNAMISFARRQIGTPYTWGGAGGWGDGYDCSGLALQALYVAGIDPQPINVIAHAAPTYRSSKQLYAHSRLQKVRFGSRQPGDLVFWQGRGGIYHVAIYVGSNQIIESNYGHARQRGLYNWGSIAPYVVRPLAS
ncbi:NlpC/P60 family protein [uncultured Varibaculum sp.]|uniref:C40 family peptidase n=1 Tax=uncultured Varibaculum sp. TaxID=413896 RepID=UPI002588CC99|nr:NlpC/P60 family protein [uncultured Varibaculum sp.]